MSTSWDLEEFKTHDRNLDAILESAQGLKTSAASLADESSMMYGILVGTYVEVFFKDNTQKAADLVENLVAAQRETREAIKTTHDLNQEAERNNRDLTGDVTAEINAAQSDVNRIL